MRFMKILLSGVITVITTISIFSISAAAKSIPILGYSQIGSESNWRTAETNSIKEAAEKAGIKLIFSDGQQKQENQIRAIRSFIKQKVDIIALDPVVETGWDTVLNEAKAAGIPVMIVDRNVKAPKSLYRTYIGSDFTLEGKNACIQLAKIMGFKGDIVVLEGTIGSAAAVNRKTGFNKELNKYINMKVIKSQSGDFTRILGYQVMKSILKTYGNKINGLFSQNDDMAIGAIRAIEEFGLKPGKDIKIVSIDGIKDIFTAMVAGKANCTIECNPLLGPQVMKAVEDILSGKSMPEWIKSNETFFTQEQAKGILVTRKY